MRLSRLQEELENAMAECAGHGASDKSMSDLYGIASAETKDAIIEVWMYNNRNRVYIFHRNDENERECKNIANYLEDVLPTWYDFYEDNNKVTQYEMAFNY